jgi:hypothetical protein
MSAIQPWLDMHMALHMVNACNTHGMKAIGGLLLLLP